MGAPAGGARAVPVDPPVRVEPYATHLSLSWQAGSLDRFVEALRETAPVTPETEAVVDATNAAGRRRVPLSAVDTTTGATTYLRVEPAAEWRVAWDRRTTPVVSLTGLPAPTTCRDLHVGTTDCEAWGREHRSQVAALVADCRDGR